MRYFLSHAGVTMHGLCLCLSDNSSQYTSEMVRVEVVCRIAYVMVFPVLLSLGIITNVLNAIVLLKMQSQQTPTPSSLYLFWLAVTHCMTCVPLIIGASIRDRTKVSYAWAIYFSHIEIPWYNALNCTCVFIIFGLSIDRYKAVCHMGTYSVIKEFKNVPRRIFLAGIIPLIAYIPICFVYFPELNEDGVTYHMIGYNNLFNYGPWKTWAVSLQLLHRLIPAFALTVINTRLLRTLNILKLQRQNMRKTSNRSHRERQLMQVLLALTVVFLLTNVPSAINYITYVCVEEVCDINYSMEIVRAISNCLEMAGYSCDFILYFLMNTEYRRGFKLLWKPCTHRSQSPRGPAAGATIKNDSTTVAE